MKKYFLLLLLPFLLVLAGCASPSPDGNNQKVTVYKSPTCGCCAGYVSYLENYGWEVEVVEDVNMLEIKERYNIPSEVESCHTMVMGDYAVEGHVPMSVLRKLLEESPDIDAIALPDMPAGSPGMPGFKNKEWDIHSLKNGQIKLFVKE